MSELIIFIILICVVYTLSSLLYCRKKKDLYQPEEYLNWDNKTLISGLDVKKLLTLEERKDINLLGVDWSSAVFTGSRAFGTHKEDSDLDIFFESGYERRFYGDFAVKLPEPWEPKPIENFDSDYPETQLNLVNGRLNIFFVGEYYPMYLDATKICLNGGSKEQFKNFIDIAHDREWYI